MIFPLHVFLTLLFLFPLSLAGQTTLEEVIGDITLPHEGMPHGVPQSYDWAQAPRAGATVPPDGWDAAIAWGQLYEWAEGNPATNTRVQIRDLELYYLSKSENRWYLLQSTTEVEGAAYVEDFAGDESKPADIRTEADGSISVTAGGGYNFHFWPASGRSRFPAGDIRACYVTVRARLILDDPEGVDDRDSARYLMGVGGDWWESLTAVWDNWTTNADMGIGRFRFVTPRWQSFNMISLPPDSVALYPPPFPSEGPDAMKPYRDTTLSTEERVEDLLGKMTLAEKVGQMTQASWTSVNPQSDMTTYSLGSLLNGGGGSPSDNTPEGWADLYDGFQARALETRLSIPYLYGTDAVHGHNNLRGAVIFPHNIGLGCTRNDSLVKEAARITAVEVAATGVDWTFAPCITVPRDERWGRTYEGFSEDPDLVARLGAAAIRGYQGSDLADSLTILACAKHYVGDGGTTGGIDQGNTELPEEELRSIHLAPYLDAIAAGTGTVMASYNSWNGEKVHGQSYLLTDVLKEELDFGGFIISDWAAIDQLPGDYASDIEKSVNAGIDMVMVPGKYKDFITGLTGLVNEGKVSMSRIDDANRRILTQKFRMGLFEDPYTRRTFFDRVGSEAHREVARQAVRESLVVLKNKNLALPLSPSASRLHVAGKSADNIGYQCGGWSISWQGGSGDITEGTTVLEAIRERTGGTVTYVQEGYSPEADGAGTAVVVIGETPYAEGQGDRDDLGLAEEDVAAVKSLYENGFRVVTVLISGRPMLLDAIWHYSDAVVAAWLPGTEGAGVADLLFGDHPPVGKLSYSWPASMEQIPINTGDDPYEPFLPYGFGIDTLALPSAADPPEALSSATMADGTLLELAFSKPLQLPDPSLLSLTVNGLPAGIASVSLREGDPHTLVITPAAPFSGGDQIRVGSPGGITAADGSVAGPFELKAHNDVEAYLSAPGRVEAEDYHRMSGIQTETCLDEGGGLNVGYIEPGDWMTYRVEISEAGPYTIDYRLASASTGGTFTLQILDGQSWDDLHTVSVEATGGWQEWTTVADTATLPGGRQTLRLLATTSGFNVNWIEFSAGITIHAPQDPQGLEVTAFPNPAGDRLTLHSGSRQPLTYILIGSSGRILASGTLRDSEIIDTSSLSGGIYLLRITDGLNIALRKIVVQK